jgi:hypothetical protein
MADFTIKQNDTWPPLSAQLKDANGPVDLTTATGVELHLKSKGTGTVTGGGACTIADAVAGRVTYTFTTADTDTVTVFDAEFEVDWGAGAISTFPNSGYFEVEITAELDTP